MNKEEFIKKMEQIREEREKAYAEMDLDKKLMLNIAALGHRSRGAVDKKGGQNRVLILLKETGPMNQRDLTHRLGIQPGSASEILRKLEDAYLIERVFDENDRRGKIVRLTENGRVLADSLEGKGEGTQDGTFSVLDESEKETLLTLMEKLNKDWQTRFPMGPDAHRHHPRGIGPRGFGESPFCGPKDFGPHGPEGFGPHGPEGFGPHGPEGFGPHGPEGFGPHGPEGFGPHGPGCFDHEVHGDLDRKSPKLQERKDFGDLDRKGHEPASREYHGDLDRKEPENTTPDPETRSDHTGSGDFNLEPLRFLAKKHKGNNKEDLA